MVPVASAEATRLLAGMDFSLTKVHGVHTTTHFGGTFVADGSYICIRTPSPGLWPALMLPTRLSRMRSDGHLQCGSGSSPREFRAW